jgi:hypothetical protein
MGGHIDDTFRVKNGSVIPLPVVSATGLSIASVTMLSAYFPALPNQPLEWTGPHHLSAMPPQASFLPLRTSVREMGAQAAEAESGIVSV